MKKILLTLAAIVILIPSLSMAAINPGADHYSGCLVLSTDPSYAGASSKQCSGAEDAEGRARQLEVYTATLEDRIAALEARENSQQLATGAPTTDSMDAARISALEARVSAVENSVTTLQKSVLTTLGSVVVFLQKLALK